MLTRANLILKLAEAQHEIEQCKTAIKSQREYIKNTVLYSYPRDNVIFKMLTWELNHPHNN